MSEVLPAGHLAAEEPPAPGQYVMSGGRLAAISTFWLGTNVLWGGLLFLLIPKEVAEMTGSRQGFAVGLTFGIGAVAALVLPLVIGPLSDRCTSRFGRRRPFMFAGVALNLVGLAAMYYFVIQKNAPTDLNGYPMRYWGYIVGFLIIQFGNNIATAAYQGIIPDVVIPSQRGTASGYLALMSQIGTVIGIVLVALVFGAEPLPSYLLMAVGLVITLLCTSMALDETPLKESPPPIGLGSFIAGLWIDPRKYPDFAWVWITRFLVMFGFYAIEPFLQYYLRDVVRVSPSPPGHVEKVAGIISLVILVAAAITGIVGGRISDRIGRKRIVYLSNAVMAIGAIIFVFCSALPQVVVVGIFFGLGYGAYISVDWALGTDVLPNKEEAGKDMAVWHISMVLPQTLAAPAAGALVAIGGITTEVVDGHRIVHYSQMGYMAAFGMAAAGLVLGAILLHNVRRVR